jgi:hypothetical protein
MLCGCVSCRCAHVQYGPDADLRFSDTATLEDDVTFPQAFLAFIHYLFTHRPDKLVDSLPTPVRKPTRGAAPSSLRSGASPPVA